MSKAHQTNKGDTMYRVIAGKAHDCYEQGDTVASGFESFKAADDFACHHTFVHADEALTSDGQLVTIIEVDEVRNEGTAYYGIYRVLDRGTWYLSDDNGGDQCFGTRKPTDADVKAYRDRLCR